jgi:tyrosine-protein kinase Etk/Wzc
MNSKENRFMAAEPTVPIAQPPPPLEESDGGSLHEYIGTLLASRGLVLSIALGAVVLGLLYAKLATPIYRSDTLIQVEEKKKGIAGLEDIAGVFPTESAADTEIEILRSRSLLSDVVEKLRLDVVAVPRRFPIVGAAIARGHRGPDVASAPLGLSRFAWGGERITVDRLEVPPGMETEKLILVAGEGGRYALLGPDGEQLFEGELGKSGSAGPVAVFVSELRARPGTQFVIAKRRKQEVTEKLQQDLVISEKGRKTGIIRVELSGRDAAQVVRTLDALAGAYVRQNVDRKSEEAEKTLQFISSQLPELKARLDKAEEALNTYRSKHGTIDLPLESKAAIEHAVDIEKVASQLQLQKAELTQKFTDNHPFLAAVKKKLAEVEAERATINERIKNLPESQLNSARLLRDVKVSNELYVLLLNKAQELQVVKSGTIGNVRILDRALAPIKPAHPRLGQTLALSLLLGLVLGVMAAFVSRALNRGVEDPDVLESATGLSVYAVVPHSGLQAQYSRGQGKRRRVDADGILAKRDPTDLAVESLRSLRTSLQFALVDAPNRVIALSGPAPGVGKTFVSSNLAQVLADSGKKVLLLEADLRNGSLHHLFNFPRQPGVSDVLVGGMRLEETVHRISDQLHVITSGLLPPNPSELLMSPRFGELVERANKQYDLVIMDTPPILAVTDAAIIGRLAAVTLLVVRAGVHPLREITLALKHFAQSGVRLTGLVFNDVTQFGGAYGYGYSYQYDYPSNLKSSLPR